jgi:hypothetical protein
MERVQPPAHIHIPVLTVAPIAGSDLYRAQVQQHNSMSNTWAARWTSTRIPGVSAASWCSRELVTLSNMLAQQRLSPLPHASCHGQHTPHAHACLAARTAATTFAFRAHNTFICHQVIQPLTPAFVGDAVPAKATSKHLLLAPSSLMVRSDPGTGNDISWCTLPVQLAARSRRARSK